MKIHKGQTIASVNIVMPKSTVRFVIRYARLVGARTESLLAASCIVFSCAGRLPLVVMGLRTCH